MVNTVVLPSPVKLSTVYVIPPPVLKVINAVPLKYSINPLSVLYLIRPNTG
jgi:hypothetical protein